MKKYPCKDCILLPSCSSYCDEMDTEVELYHLFLKDPRCYDCGHIIFLKDKTKLGLDFVCDNCGSLFKIMTSTSLWTYSEPVSLHRVNKIAYLMNTNVSKIKYDEKTTGPYLRNIILTFSKDMMEKYGKP